MILPITTFGNNILRKKGTDISKDFANLDKLISDMQETMINAKGIGISAHQVDKALNLFLVDTFLLESVYDKVESFKEVFINPSINKLYGEDVEMQEGCLSIPNINETVSRKDKIDITYFNQKFELKSKKFSGIISRIIQHEYDHIKGILFIDKIDDLKKELIKSKLDKICNKKISVNYPIV